MLHLTRNQGDIFHSKCLRGIETQMCVNLCSMWLEIFEFNNYFSLGAHMLDSCKYYGKGPLFFWTRNCKVPPLRSYFERHNLKGLSRDL